METRKRRATELIEKCDFKLSPFVERTSIVQIYDRKVKIELGESVMLANTSLYSLLRAWVQDDPDKSFVDDMRVRRIRNMTADSYSSETKVTSAHNPLIKVNDDFLAEVDKKDHIDIKDHIQSFKEIRERSKIAAANKYARMIYSLDEKSVPRLMTMEKLLRDQEYSLTHTRQEETSSRSNEFDSE